MRIQITCVCTLTPLVLVSFKPILVPIQRGGLCDLLFEIDLKKYKLDIILKGRKHIHHSNIRMAEHITMAVLLNRPNVRYNLFEDNDNIRHTALNAAILEFGEQNVLDCLEAGLSRLSSSRSGLILPKTIQKLNHDIEYVNMCLA